MKLAAKKLSKGQLKIFKLKFLKVIEDLTFKEKRCALLETLSKKIYLLILTTDGVGVATRL